MVKSGVFDVGDERNSENNQIHDEKKLVCSSFCQNNMAAMDEQNQEQGDTQNPLSPSVFSASNEQPGWNGFMLHAISEEEEKEGLKYICSSMEENRWLYYQNTNNMVTKSAPTPCLTLEDNREAWEAAKARFIYTDQSKEASKFSVFKSTSMEDPVMAVLLSKKKNNKPKIKKGKFRFGFPSPSEHPPLLTEPTVGNKLRSASLIKPPEKDAPPIQSPVSLSASVSSLGTNTNMAGHVGFEHADLGDRDVSGTVPQIATVCPSVFPPLRQNAINAGVEFEKDKEQFPIFKDRDCIPINAVGPVDFNPPLFKKPNKIMG